MTQQLYDRLLQEYNQYRDTVLIEKQTQHQELEKYKAHLDKMYSQMAKKYQSVLEEERVAHQRKMAKQQHSWKVKVEQLSQSCKRKDQMIQELRDRLNESEKAKHEVIEESTRMLCEIAQGMEESETRNGPLQNSYHELARMYQFVVEENNSLKKDLYRVGHPLPQEAETLEKVSSAKKMQAKQENSTSILNHSVKPRKKKAASHSSTDQSKLHNESIRLKSGLPKPTKK